MGIHTPTRTQQTRVHRRSANPTGTGRRPRPTTGLPTISARKALATSRTRAVIAALACAAAAATALPAPAAASVVAFYMPGTSPHPASSGTVDVAAIGAAATGWITQAQQVGYPASLLPATGTMALDASVAQGVANLAAALASVPATASILLFGVSQGDIVLTYEEQALIAAGHPNNITFIRLADPSGPTGIMGRNAGLLLPGISFVRAPTDSPYNTVYVVHQYDVFAHWPAQQLNLIADANAVAGGILYHNYASYNIDLSTLPASDVTTTVNSQGATTTTYFIRDTGMLPLLKLMKTAGVSSNVVNTLQPILKPIVDSAYAPQPRTAVMAQRVFQAAVSATVAAGYRAAGAARGTQATLSAAAARLTRSLPPIPRPSAATARRAIAALPKPVAGIKPPRAQSTTTVAAFATTTPAVPGHRTTKPGTAAAASPTRAPKSTRPPASNRPDRR